MKPVVNTKFIYEPLYYNKDFLHQKYVVEGRSVAQIADEIVSSKEAVRQGLIRFEIPLRNPHRPHNNPAQTRFGQKKQKGQLVPHNAEAKVIQAARDMASQGMSLRQIAKFLGQIGVPTKQRGKAWHPEMVRRLLIPFVATKEKTGKAHDEAKVSRK